METILVVGTSGHAATVIDAIEAASQYRVIGLLEATASGRGFVLGYPILGTDAGLPRVMEEHDVRSAVVAIGDNFIRGRVVAALSQACPELQFPALIHPAATVARSARIGPGALALAGAVISAGSEMGRHCIVYTLASLDHGAKLGDFASLAPHAAVGGNATIGEHSAVGIGASIIHGVSVGSHTIIGAGATVVRDITGCCVAYGTPAREIRNRTPGDRYL